MLEMIKGAKIKNAINLEEGYEMQENFLLANVDASKIINLIQDFIKENKEDSFFLFIEIPTNKEEEIKLQAKEKTEKLHMDIYYLDGITEKEANVFLEEYGEVLIHDGVVQFGFGTQRNEEIGKYKYNLVKIYSKDNLKKYTKILENHNIVKKEKVKTAWDFFTKENPGTSFSYYDKNEKNIYDCLKELKEKGLYKAETRVE